MANKDQVLEALKREWDNKLKHSIDRYNTGYEGRGVRSEETTTMRALEEAASEFKDYALKSVAPGHSVRVAASFSGTEHNEWSVLVEQNSPHQSIFNFHIRVSG